jgi:predicted amidohydrolase
VEERSPRPRLLFTGESQVVGPEGRARAQAPAEGTALLVVEVDPSEARSKAIPSGNDLFRERRPEAYL